MKKNICTVEVPISDFGIISESKITIGGKFHVVDSTNSEKWESALFQIYDLLKCNGLMME